AAPGATPAVSSPVHRPPAGAAGTVAWLGRERSRAGVDSTSSLRNARRESDIRVAGTRRRAGRRGHTDETVRARSRRRLRDTVTSGHRGCPWGWLCERVRAAGRPPAAKLTAGDRPAMRVPPAGLRSAPVDLDLLFLGTAGSAPTASRGTSATLVRRGGDRLLVDCGEGTQRQLLRSDAGLSDLEDVLLTHLHADHVLGLPGMLKTFALRGRELPIVVYGPRGTRGLLQALGVVIGRLTYELRVVELSAGDTVERDGYRLEPFAVKHGGNALGYALREHERPGRFDVAAADALGVPGGPARGALQRGEDVTL